MSRQRDRRSRPRQERRRGPVGRLVERVGGIRVLLPVFIALLVVVALVALNRPEAARGEPYEPVERTAVDGRAYGDPDAPVLMVEFADFQCPFCALHARETAPELRDLVEAGDLRIEYRHMAFLGDESVRAAEAAECALDQGRFWDYHDLLFLRQGAENSGAFSDARLKDLARELQEHFEAFDTAAFDACLDSGAKRATVREMTREAEAIGVRSTPSFLVNGRPITGAQDAEVFREAIEEAKQAAQAGEAGQAGRAG